MATFTRAIQRGWKPRPLDTIPEEYLYGYSNAGKAVFKDMGVFQFAELILMHMPLVLKERNDEAKRMATRKQTESIQGYAEGSASGVAKRHGQATVDQNDIQVTSGNRGRVPPVGN